MIKFLSSILLLSMVACGQATSKQSTDAKETLADAGWNTFSQANYSIKYPAAWELNQSGEMGTSFILFSPKESEQDDFRENINLIIQDLSGKNIDLNKYTEISEGQIKSMIANSNLIESKRIKNDSIEYQKIVYAGDQQTFHLKYEQYYWVINDMAYILTFTSEQTKFKDLQGTAEKMMNSFILKK